MLPWAAGLLAILAAASLAGAGPARSDEASSRVVTLLVPSAEGAAVRGRVDPDRVDRYGILAAAGQRLVLSFAATTPNARFTVFAPGSDSALVEGEAGETSLDLVLAATGLYQIRVGIDGDAARRGEGADYRLVLRLTDETP